MKQFFKYADIAIPAGTIIKACIDNLPTSFDWPVKVRGKMATYKDGRPKGSKPVWLFIIHGYRYYLEQSREGEVFISNEVARSANA